MRHTLDIQLNNGKDWLSSLCGYVTLVDLCKCVCVCLTTTELTSNSIGNISPTMVSYKRINIIIINKQPQRNVVLQCPVSITKKHSCDMFLRLLGMETYYNFIDWSYNATTLQRCHIWWRHTWPHITEQYAGGEWKLMLKFMFQIKPNLVYTCKMFMFRHNILSWLSVSNDCPDETCLLIKFQI